MRTLIIDGANDFIRNFVVVPTLDSNGNPAGGISGCLKSLLRFVRIIRPDNIIYVWDGKEASKKKRDIYPDYKKGRKVRQPGRLYDLGSDAAALKNKEWQMQTLIGILDCLPIMQIITDKSEADDVISYICNERDDFGYDNIVIATSDKDYYQLLDERTVIYNQVKKDFVSVKNVVDNYEIHPNNWLFYRAIDGDTSDNLKGVPGFGPKTIKKLFPELKEEKKVGTSIIKKCLEKKDEYKESQQKRLNTLNENFSTIERNWKLMSLQEPMLSLPEIRKINSKIENFKPLLSVKKFYILVSNVGDLGIDLSFVNFFIRYQ